MSFRFNGVSKRKMLISNAAKPLRFVLGVFFIYSRTVGVGCLFIFWMLPFDAQVFNVVAVPIPLFFLSVALSSTIPEMCWSNLALSRGSSSGQGEGQTRIITRDGTSL